MASSLNKAPTAITIDVEDLAEQAWKGQIRVPHFQRGFRWGWEDVRRLFDSMVKGYPIGSLLLWQRRAQRASISLGALTIEAPDSEKAFWVVDGQQRLTSIASALTADGASDSRFALSYDLRKNEFVRPPTVFNPLIVPLYILFDLQSVLKWFSANPGVADYLGAATLVTKTLRQYEVPAYLVESDDPEILQDIFDRMNNFGKRLTRAEIFTALNAGNEAAEGGVTLEAIAANVDGDLGFGSIDDDTILAAVLARRNPQVKRDIRREFDAPGDEGLAAAYGATEAALKLAISFLQEEAGVPHYTFLAYRYLLVVLTRFFAHYPELDKRNAQLLRRWYWQAAVVGPERFKGGTPNAARILCGKISENDQSGSIQRLLAAVKASEPRTPDARRFSSQDSSSKLLLGALWANGPRDPRTGSVYTRDDITRALEDSSTSRPAVKTLISRNEIPIDHRGWAANRILSPSESTSENDFLPLLTTRPLDLNAEEWEMVLESHFISKRSLMLLDRGNYGGFLNSRQIDLESWLENFLESVCEWGFEATPPLSSFDLDDESESSEAGENENLTLLEPDDFY